MAARFRAFSDGRYEWLIGEWRRDIANARAKVRSNSSNEGPALEAVRLIRDLEVGRATDRLLSLGLGDIRIAEVSAQAENKHPQRQDDVLPDPMEYFGA